MAYKKNALLFFHFWAQNLRPPTTTFEEAQDFYELCSPSFYGAPNRTP